jgi:SAM-dependent methyltransferase
MDKTGGGTDYTGITKRQQETWATGDFHEVARQNVCMAEALCEATDPHATDRVLDVACGSGTAALVAARRYCEVTGIDYVPTLIDRAGARAAASGLEVDFRVADAQELPLDDDSFDFVLSVYGVQFAPNQQQAAREMLRVCRPGGTIGLATPIAEGWSGDFFRVNANYAPPPPGVHSPLRWGTDEGLEELLGPGVRSIENEERIALQYYRSLDHAVDVFTTFFGPTMRAGEQLDEDSKERLRDDVGSVFAKYNRATDGTAVIENRYRMTIATCR